MALITASSKPRPRGTDWDYLRHLGDEWLTENYTGYTSEQARGTGYARAIWQECNPPPGKIRRVNVAVNSGEVESVVGDSDYDTRLKAWQRARNIYLRDYVFNEYGLRPTPKADPATTEDIPLTATRDAVFDKVRGKGLPEYERPVAQTEPVPKKKKRRGLPFRRGGDERQYQNRR
jgi:hypothetical protein